MSISDGMVRSSCRQQLYIEARPCPGGRRQLGEHTCKSNWRKVERTWRTDPMNSPRSKIRTSMARAVEIFSGETLWTEIRKESKWHEVTRLSCLYTAWRRRSRDKCPTVAFGSRCGIGQTRHQTGKVIPWMESSHNYELISCWRGRQRISRLSGIRRRRSGAMV